MKTMIYAAFASLLLAMGCEKQHITQPQTLTYTISGANAFAIIYSNKLDTTIYLNVDSIVSYTEEVHVGDSLYCAVFAYWYPATVKITLGRRLIAIHQTDSLTGFISIKGRLNASLFE
ncbi:MAG: hypothetical protein IRZ03_18000 [Acidobacterium ailaaui]|nr:hypothetical protein [Pseudacidobacterium ailaaui]